MALGIISLIAKFAPELIKQGYVYRIEPPLYRFSKNGKMKYIMSQRALYEYVQAEFSKSCKMSRQTLNNKEVELDKDAIIRFLKINFAYADKLRTLARKRTCSPLLMELIALYYNPSNKESKTVKYWKTVLKDYKDLEVGTEDGHLIINGVDGDEAIHIVLDKSFDKMVMKFRSIQCSNLYIYGYTVNKRSNLSLYEVMCEFEKFMPGDIYRFKGLGEIDSEKLGELCLDPANRTSTRIKFGDVTKDMEMINVLLSSKAHYRALRKDLLMNIVADDIEIDT